jgi:MscS family membrane protein
MMRLRSVVTLLILSIPLPTNAQSRGRADFHPLEPSDTSTPSATLDSLIRSCNELQQQISAGLLSEGRTDEILPTTERILDCLDLSHLPEELRGTAGIHAALFLKEVLDRTPLPSDEEIPTPLESDPNKGMRWRIPQTRILIAQPQEGPRQDSCLFSSETVRRAPDFYRLVRSLPYRTTGREVSPGLYDAYIAATKRGVTQTSDTSSPRGTLTLFLDSTNEIYEMTRGPQPLDRTSVEGEALVDRTLSCLDTSRLPEYAREHFAAEAAVCLKEVLDRIPLPPAEEIPGIEAIDTTGSGEKLERWQVPNSQITIARIQDGPRRGEFLFTSGTVDRAPELYRKLASNPYRSEGRPVSKGLYQWWLSSPGTPVVARMVDYLPSWSQNRYFGMAIWQWIGLTIATPIGLALMFAVFRLGRWQGERSRERSLLRYWLGALIPIVAILIPLGFKQFAYDYLTLRGNPFYVVGFCAELIALLGLMGLMIVLSNRIAETLIALPKISSGSLDANLIRLVCRVLGIAAASVIFLEGGKILGFPISTLIASAGIGGLAIALSAQGLIKGLFGTVTILMDKPFRVGDRIVVNGHDGFVEDIGLRSTKVRGFLDNNLVSIPNDLLAESEIENVGRRSHIRRTTDIHIPLDTPFEKVERALAILREVLKDHEGMDPAFPPRVCFTDFNPESFNLRFDYWFTPPELWKHNAFAEEINLRIFRTFEKEGIQFSLPQRVSYWKTDNQQGPMEICVRRDVDTSGEKSNAMADLASDS